MAMSQEHGSTLQEVQQLMKKNQVRESNQLTYSIKVTDTNTYMFTFFFSYLCISFTFELLFIILLSGYHCSAFKQMQNLKPAFNSLSFYHSFQTLQRELQGHKGKIEDVLERAGIIASIRSPEADNIRTGHDQLAQLWSLLWVESERRQLVLDAMYQAQQYFFDTAEVEAWLSEQELHMMNEEKGKVCV